MSAFLSFVGGAAKQFVSSAEQAEEDAKQMAKASFNGLYKRYEENADSNRELTNKMRAEKQYIETVWSNATPEQVNELLANPVALEAIKKVKNPSSVSLDNYIKVIKGNESKATAAERAAALPDLIERAKEGLRPAKKEGFAGFMQGFGDTRFDADMEKYARGQGMTLEQLRGSQKAARPTGSAAFDMGVLHEAKGFAERVDDAKALMLNAQKSGDPNLIKAANVVATSIQKTNDAFSPEQKQFTKRLDDARTVLLSPTKFTPEQVKEANNVFDNYINMERRKAVGTKVSDAKDDTPKIGALNSYVSGAVSKELIATFGEQIKKGELTFTPNASGEVTANILMTDMGERFKVASMQYEAARRALAIFSDPKTGEPISNDGKAVLGQYKAALDRAREQYLLTDAGKAELGAPSPLAPPVKPTTVTPAQTAATPPAQPVKPASAAPITPVTPADVDRIRAEGKAAIANGAPADVVAKRFKEVTREEF